MNYELGRLTGLIVFSAVITATTMAQERPDAASSLLKDASVKAALEAAKAGEAQTIEDQIRFCEVPAPSFKEAARGNGLKQSFQQLGLRNVRVDKAATVPAVAPVGPPVPVVVIARNVATRLPAGCR